MERLILPPFTQWYNVSGHSDSNLWLHSDLIELAASCQSIVASRGWSSISLGDKKLGDSDQMTHGTHNARQELPAASARELTRPLCSHTGRVKFPPLIPGIEAEQVVKPAKMRF